MEMCLITIDFCFLIDVLRIFGIEEPTANETIKL